MLATASISVFLVDDAAGCPTDSLSSTALFFLVKLLMGISLGGLLGCALSSPNRRCPRYTNFTEHLLNSSSRFSGVVLDS